MKAYFNERNILVIDGEGAKIEYDPDVIPYPSETDKRIGNVLFISKRKQICREIDDVVVSSRDGPKGNPYRILIAIKDSATVATVDKAGVPIGPSIPGDILSVESARKLITALADAIAYVEATPR